MDHFLKIFIEFVTTLLLFYVLFCFGHGPGRIIAHQSVQSLNHVRLFATPWTAASQASLSITNSWSLLKLMSLLAFPKVSWRFTGFWINWIRCFFHAISCLARSRRVAHFHQGLPVSPVPTPGSRRGSRTSLLPPGQTQGQYIHPTETIQAVYDLGIKRGLQKGKMS